MEFMRFLHLSDLHLGRRLGELSLIEDQRFILAQIIRLVREEHPDSILIAGDVYDKSIPSTEAVIMFDGFLNELSELGVPTLIISGNHDSAERLSFASKLIAKSGVHIASVYDGTLFPITLSDGETDVNFYLLPFIKPSNVKRFYPDADITSYTDALRCAIQNADIDYSALNVLVTHQFVTGAQRSESEEISVGGADNCDASVFDGFDYVALGHIHRAQIAGAPHVRYCGTPLKYSFSEASHNKTFTMVELTGKGELHIKEYPIKSLREIREIRGTYDEIAARSYYADTGLRDELLHITLTDEDDVPDAIGRLRTIYRYLLKLDYDNARTRSEAEITPMQDLEEKSPLELVCDLFRLQNDREMTAEQKRYCAELFDRMKEEA